MQLRTKSIAGTGLWSLFFLCFVTAPGNADDGDFVGLVDRSGELACEGSKSFSEKDLKERCADDTTCRLSAKKNHLLFKFGFKAVQGSDSKVTISLPDGESCIALRSDIRLIENRVSSVKDSSGVCKSHGGLGAQDCEHTED